MHNHNYNATKIANIVCMPVFVDFVEAGKHPNHGYYNNKHWDAATGKYVETLEDPDKIEFWRAQITLCPDFAGEEVRVGEYTIPKRIYANAYKPELLKGPLKLYRKGHGYIWGKARDRYPTSLDAYPSFKHLLVEMDVDGFIDNPDGKFPSLLRAHFESSMR